MRTKLFQLIPVAVFVLFSACQGSKATKTPYFSSSSIPFSIEQSATPMPLPIAPVDPDVWDTSNVDISDVNKDRKLISFTFDDCPSRTIENILAVFAAYNEDNPDCKATATFFFNGRYFDEQTPHLLQTALTLDMELGNHTYSHADLTTLTEEELEREIDKTDELLYQADGKARHLLRAPFGRLNKQIKTLAPTPFIDWTIDTLDWTGISEEKIYNVVSENKFSGAIVLMHDGYEHTVSALKRLLPDLKKEGYQVVSLSKMSKAHDCPFRRGSVYIRARKQK